MKKKKTDVFERVLVEWILYERKLNGSTRKYKPDSKIKVRGEDL